MLQTHNVPGVLFARGNSRRRSSVVLFMVVPNCLTGTSSKETDIVHHIPP